MRQDKWRRAVVAAGHIGTCGATANTILNKIPDNIVNKLTGTEVGQLMQLLNDSYNAGKTACGAEVLDGGEYIWIDKLDKMYDLADIKTLQGCNDNV